MAQNWPIMTLADNYIIHDNSTCFKEQSQERETNVIINKQLLFVHKTGHRVRFTAHANRSRSHEREQGCKCARSFSRTVERKPVRLFSEARSRLDFDRLARKNLKKKKKKNRRSEGINWSVTDTRRPFNLDRFLNI